MNTQIEKDFYFQAGVHFEGKFYINSFDLTLSLSVETDSIREQNIAMDRITHFLEQVIQNSVLVPTVDTISIEKYKNAGLKVCELPEEPYDQIVSLVLMQKLNAVMENRLKVTDLILGSTMSDGVRYTVEQETAKTLLSGNHWWNKSSICMNNQEAHCTGDNSKDNIVKLFDDMHWTELGLAWKEKKGKK